MWRNTNQTSSKKDFVRNKKTVPWPSKSTSPWTQSESFVQLALATLKYWSEIKQMFRRKRKRVLTCLQSFWWPLTSAQVPWLWSYVTSLLNIVLITSPPCEGKGSKNAAVRVKKVKHPCWCCSVHSALTSDGRAYSTVSKMSSPWTAVPFMSV